MNNTDEAGKAENSMNETLIPQKNGTRADRLRKVGNDETLDWDAHITEPVKHTPRLVEIIADRKGRLSMYRFIKEIDRLIESEAPSTHLWNYCVQNRKSVLAKAEGNEQGSEVNAS